MALKIVLVVVLELWLNMEDIIILFYLNYINMEIVNVQTKFAIGNEVYFLYHNEIKNGKIYLMDVNITIFNGGSVTDVYYKIADKNNKFIGSFVEELLYETKEQLING